MLSLAFSGINAAAFVTNPTATLLVARSADSAAARLERVLATYATPDVIERRIELLMTEQPRDWMRIDGLLDLAKAQGIPLDPAVVERARILRDEDHDMLARSVQCVRCLADPTGCDLTLVFICRAPVELTPVGDVWSLARQGGRYAAGGDVDEVELGLATIGLGAFALTAVTAGQSLTVKVGASVAKLAYRLGALPAAAISAARQAARNGIDWHAMAAARPWNLHSTLGRAIRPEAVRPAASFLESTGEMRATIGVGRTLFVLRRVERLWEARGMARAARHLEERTVGAVEMAGVSRLARAAMRWAPELYRLLAGLAAAMLALVGLTLSAVQSGGLRWFRRRLRSAAQKTL